MASPTGQWSQSRHRQQENQAKQIDPVSQVDLLSVTSKMARERARLAELQVEAQFLEQQQL